MGGGDSENVPFLGNGVAAEDLSATTQNCDLHSCLTGVCRQEVGNDVDCGGKRQQALPSALLRRRNQADYSLHTANRPTYDDFRSCKHDVALVKWDPEFDMVDSHVPLKPDLYAKENQHCGWNLVRDDFVEFVCTQLAQCRSLEQQQATKSD